MRDEESVFGEYVDESRVVCSRNGRIAVEYGDGGQALRIVTPFSISYADEKSDCDESLILPPF